MGYQLTPCGEEFLQRARQLAQGPFKERAAEIDATGEYPWDNVRAMAENGLCGLNIPRKYGGSEEKMLTICAVMEEISKVCASSGSILAAYLLGSFPIVIVGNTDQKDKYLRPVANGEKACTLCITEPEAGSDVAGIQTTAARNPQGYRLNGKKILAGNGGAAGNYVVLAKTDAATGIQGISTFIIEKETPGFNIVGFEKKMGMRGTMTARINLDDCVVPVENLLGKEGEGFLNVMKTLDLARISAGAQAVGIAQGAFEESLGFAKARQTFGRPIAKHQGLQWMLAEMATQIEAARLLICEAAEKADLGERITQVAAMAKLFATQMSHRVVHAAVQIHGGRGYLEGYPVERMYRDQRVTEIWEGTSEILKIVIGREMLKHCSEEVIER